MKRSIVTLIVAVLAMPVLAQAQQSDGELYCDQRKLGHWFYCDEPEPEPAEDGEVPIENTAAQPSYTEQLASISRELDERKARAILEPTTENVREYISFQRQQLDRASGFADVWARTVWQNPDLDYTLERPVGNLGKQSWRTERTAAQDSMMRDLTQRYGVFYFYSQSCGACSTFSPIVRGLSDRYGLDVLAVSMDGGVTPGFPEYVVNQGQYERMGLQGSRVPALVLFDTETKSTVPIGYGVMAQDEVIQRIFYLTQTQPGEDY